MTIKTILVAASGGTASEGAIELGCRLARKFEAHLEAYHVLTDVREILLATGEGFGMPMSGELIDRITEDAAALAAKTKAAFEAALARHAIASAAAPGKAGASGGWREESGYGPYLVAQRARFFDLVLLGRSERVVDQPHSDAVEQTLLQSGRPVLLAPAKPPQALGDSIAFGWNGEAAAVRALTGSLPLLAAARTVNVIVVGEKHRTSAAALVEHLAWHGIKASLRPAYAIEGVGPGEQLLAEARDAGADLLVMGGYGHRPWREALFGGATREIVGVSLLPILLSH
jgi:nucleotide-binding universal stress UspA family protein